MRGVAQQSLAPDLGRRAGKSGAILSVFGLRLPSQAGEAKHYAPEK